VVASVSWLGAGAYVLLLLLLLVVVVPVRNYEHLQVVIDCEMFCSTGAAQSCPMMGGPVVRMCSLGRAYCGVFNCRIYVCDTCLNPP
jgi:hypothetical protein